MSADIEYNSMGRSADTHVNVRCGKKFVFFIQRYPKVLGRH